MQMRTQSCMHVYVCYRRPDFGRLPGLLLYTRAVERIIYDLATEQALDCNNHVHTNRLILQHCKEQFIDTLKLVYLD